MFKLLHARSLVLVFADNRPKVGALKTDPLFYPVIVSIISQFDNNATEPIFRHR